MISMEIIERINSLCEAKSSVIVAIDGMSGSGKSALGYELAEHFNANLFHMDDFFLPPQSRVEARLSEPGGNVSYERFNNEVIKKLKAGEEFIYDIYSCKDDTMTKSPLVTPKKVNIIEGAYSMHPYFGKAYDLTIVVTIESQLQCERIRVRNGEEMLVRFVNEWIPLENNYLQKTHATTNCDILLDENC